MIMKAIKLFAALTIFVFVATSCKNESESKAEKSVDQYVTYIDSVIKIEPEIAAEDWVDIEASAEFKKSEAQESLDAIDDRELLETKLESSSKKFDVYKEGVESKMEIAEGNSSSEVPLSKRLFGIVIGKDLNFNWVNKDNILTVYQNFVNTVSSNKKQYSREDWDEIKLLYEALDTRKNTVEKEGLSTKDNLKIAALKTEFGPMFKLNRMSAKSEENAEAKS
ncbi:hypothetical protein SAMN05444363_2700 [Flavobacterium terrae]|uniref:Lipoprotein n=2 Tax=Flavobacterium terrae TaxID=415425 RepID=A0A1M6GNH0_9FLAO|nr:hypothetical protein SAMN05444363_2700 [Flavobacterium terrae]